MLSVVAGSEVDAVVVLLLIIGKGGYVPLGNLVVYFNRRNLSERVNILSPKN